MEKVVISGLGLYHPPTAVTNETLVTSYNQYVEQFNHQHQQAIAAGECAALKPSSAAFIEKASGIKSRYLMDPESVLDINIMQPVFAKRGDDELSLQAEMCVKAAQEALGSAGLNAVDIDLIVVACSNLQRPYPAISIEVQQALGAKGMAYDMNVACSSATFAIFNAYQAIKAGGVKRALLINPEICSAHLNFCDRDSHFIFGDACTATVLEAESVLKKQEQLYEVLDAHLLTQFSNNIRNNFGFLTRVEKDVLDQPAHIYDKDQMFVQNGRRVFRDVVPMVSQLIIGHLERNQLTPEDLARIWLHQANAHINDLVAEKVFSRKIDANLAPIILDEFANTSSPGCLIAFKRYHQDLEPGSLGLLCSFGAGYSAGSVIVKKLA